MPYYPKSQIKTNLYTNGDEFILAKGKSQVPYKGSYYITSKGETFTGKFPYDGSNNSLLPLSSNLVNTTIINGPSLITPIDRGLTITQKDIIDPEFNHLAVPQFVKTYSNTLQRPTPPRKIPLFKLTLPTEDDYNKGYMFRYFSKKRNSIKFIEISKETYTEFKDSAPGTAVDLYAVTSLKWVIKGDNQIVYNQNKNLTTQLSIKLRWSGFVEYFRDNFTKYLK